MTRPRVLFTCGREPQYVRNLLLRRALREHCQVVEVTDSRPGSLLRRNLRLMPRLLGALRERHDLVFVGFYGHLLTLLLSRLTRAPLLFDVFLSTWDTFCFDRQLFPPHSQRGKAAYWVDRQACQAASHCLLDTKAHKEYFGATFGIADDRMSAFYVGYDPEVFFPRPEAVHLDRFVVFSYGSFLPLHGVEHIVQAAKLLEEDKEIEVHVVGEGPQFRQALEVAEQLQVQNLHLRPPVRYEELPQAIAQASLCLGGPFGATDKAHRVIAGKTFQFLAMAKPTIVGESPANHELFTHARDVWMCRMADPQALADAVRRLKQDAALRRDIGQRGYELCRGRFGIEQQGQRLMQIISGLL